MSDINLSEIPSGYHDNYLIKLSRFGLVGWALAIFFAVICFIQFLVVATKPIQAVGVNESGVVVGAVVFDEPESRPMDRISGDLKRWAEACVSENKLSVFDDMALCVTHYSEDLLSERIKESDSVDIYVMGIAESGCEKTETLFDESTVFQRDDTGLWVNGILSGKIVCSDKKLIQTQSFKIDVTAMVVLKTTAKPLGLEVYKYEDIK